MSFAGEIFGELGGFLIAFLKLLGSFFQSILFSIGQAFSSIIFSSIVPAGLLGPSLMVFTFGMTFAVAMGAFAFVKGVGDVTGDP